MTQFGRYAKTTRKEFEDCLIVQDVHLSPDGEPADPVETQETKGVGGGPRAGDWCAAPPRDPRRLRSSGPLPLHLGPPLLLGGIRSPRGTRLQLVELLPPKAS